MGLLRNIPLARYTTWGVGGPADFFVEPSDEQELADALRFAQEEGIIPFFIGSGSNLLVHDNGFRGMVVRMSLLNEFSVDGTKVTVQAGVKLPRLARITADMGLSGLEELAGIPGTIGGAIIQNAGAYGREIGELVNWVEIYGDDGVERYRSDALKFLYRKTILPSEGPILRVQLELKKGVVERIRSRMRELLIDRHRKQPRGRTAGSVFKNPEGARPAGWLLDRAGVKGLRVGGAEYSHIHANFIVNIGGASASDIFQLIQIGKRRVMEQFRIELETEVVMVGDFDGPV